MVQGGPPLSSLKRGGAGSRALWESLLKAGALGPWGNHYTLVEGVSVLFQRRCGRVNIKAAVSNWEPSGLCGCFLNCW